MVADFRAEAVTTALTALRSEVDGMTSWPSVSWGRDGQPPHENIVVVDRAAVLDRIDKALGHV
jgi:hypothetical protein